MRFFDRLSIHFPKIISRIISISQVAKDIHKFFKMSKLTLYIMEGFGKVFFFFAQIRVGLYCKGENTSLSCKQLGGTKIKIK